MSDPNDTQIGGEHYKKYPIQPWDYIMKNNIPWAEGCIIEWATRWRDKGGVQDLEKAKHMIDKILANDRAKRAEEPLKKLREKYHPESRPGWIGLDEYLRQQAKETTDPLCDCERCVAE